MHAHRLTAAALTVALALALLPPAAAADPAAAPTPAEVTRLGRQARGSDDDRALEALRALAELGEPAAAELKAAAAARLDRDARLLQRAAPATAAKLAAMQKQMDAQRAAAWSVINALTKDTVPQARQNYDRLLAMQAELDRAYARLAPLVEARARRKELAELWRSAAPEEEHAARDEAEAALLEQADAALGLDGDDARACVDWAGRNPGDGEGVTAELRRFFARRAIEQYNARRAGLMNRQEQVNATLVNQYRAALGTLPLEWDPRVILAARRHSKEMVELKFFDHESPTPANKTHTQRMKNAGHPHGTAENIAAGSGSGEATFWQWFNSPGHHKNMVARGHVSLGVGQWSSTWTQNFASGPRLAPLPRPDQDAIETQGPPLPPQ